MDSNNVSEAMGLAGMNPVVGVPADHSHRGSLIVNVTNHDKDLEDDGKRMTTVARNLDMDDNLYGIDRFGKVFAKKKYEVMERPDVWEKDIVEVFKVNKDCEPIIEQLEKEASLPYDERPIHKPTYIYEAITGHTMYTEDQMYYDRLLEKVELEKMSAVLSGTSGGLGRQKNLEQKGNKDAGYIPDNDFPSGTENMNSGIVLASAELQEGFLDAIKGKFREMHHKGIRDALGYYKYPIYAIVPYGRDPEGMFCSSFELAFNDYVFYFNKDFVKKNKLDITSKYKVPKEWWSKNKDELVEVYVLSYPKKITEPSVFTPDHLDMLDGIKFGPYHLEDLAKAMGIDSIQEAMVELWEQNGRDLKLLREISNMRIELDKDTIYSTNEGFFSNLKQKFNDTRYSLARKGNDYIKYPNAIYRISNKTCHRPYTPDLNYAIMDYLIDVNPEMKGKKVSDKIEISKEWWEKHKNDKLTFEMYNYPEPVKKNRMYAINFVNYNTEGMALPMDLEDLVNSYNGVQVSVKESTSLQDGLYSILGVSKDE